MIESSGSTRDFERSSPIGAPYGPDSPWMSTPLAVGIDHVFMCLSFSRYTQAIATIEDLAKKYQLAIWDPQSGEAYLPGT
ncbi:hypothetical protein KGQ19_21365 [Catenulispora sp. NL8]|uniref:TIR domain-containing protein n=1 Tax=Catenulispora pinistramenti TaxID=2705254 RepID=A0ABS5KTN7_9ACTN|nr:hypothetical protein [Catenulispora pinistramenti]MBS2549416.1 hypothetical protein [Catenulispora pinistramenti]